MMLHRQKNERRCKRWNSCGTEGSSQPHITWAERIGITWGPLPDGERAEQWFRLSAEQGNQYAQYVLGKRYLQGKEVEQNQETAEYWLTQSTFQGTPYAQFLLERQQRDPSALLCAARLFYHMSIIFWETLPPPNPAGGHTESKLLRRIREKKMAMGHKADDHEEQQQGGWNMTM